LRYLRPRVSSYRRGGGARETLVRRLQSKHRAHHVSRSVQDQEPLGLVVVAKALSGTMERTLWTDERLDDRMTGIDANFDRLFAELHAIRGEMAELRAELTRLHRHVTLIMTTLAVALVGVVGVGQV
jgi:hypothetical protein